MRARQNAITQTSKKRQSNIAQQKLQILVKPMEEFACFN